MLSKELFWVAFVIFFSAVGIRVLLLIFGPKTEAFKLDANKAFYSLIALAVAAKYIFG